MTIAGGMQYIPLESIHALTGAVLAEATNDSPIATAEIRLDHQFLRPRLGDMKHRTWKERRPDIPVE
jgi:hypothetical protein